MQAIIAMHVESLVIAAASAAYTASSLGASSEQVALAVVAAVRSYGRWSTFGASAALDCCPAKVDGSTPHVTTAEPSAAAVKTELLKTSVDEGEGSASTSGSSRRGRAAPPDARDEAKGPPSLSIHARRLPADRQGGARKLEQSWHMGVDLSAQVRKKACRRMERQA